MDVSGFIAVLQESLFMVIVFAGFIFYTIWAGRQSITNLILGLYFALLISIEFPFYKTLLGSSTSKQSESILMLIVFGLFAIGMTILFKRLMPREYAERKFEGFFKKVLLAGAATVLVMAFSYNALPVTEFLTPGDPIHYLFGSPQSFFYWLIAPLVILFFV